MSTMAVVHDMRLRSAGPDLTAEQIAACPAPEQALDLALRTILEAVEATAGAVCVLDAREELLRLRAAVGLSEDGRRSLAEATWSAPLDSLRRRRVHVVDVAAAPDDVPPLVEPGTAVRTVVCLPVYSGSSAQGSLVIVTPRVLAEGDLSPLTAALEQLGYLVAVVRQEDIRPEVASPSNPVAEELVQLAGDLARIGGDAGGVAPVLAALEANERRRGFLVSTLELTLRAERARMQAVLAHAEAAVANARTLVAAAGTPAATPDTDETPDALRARIERLEGERDTLRAERDRALAMGAAREAEAARLAEALAKEVAEHGRLAAAIAEAPIVTPEAATVVEDVVEPAPVATPAADLVAPRAGVALVVDVGGVWPVAAAPAEEVSVVGPEALRDRLAAIRPAAVVANLAAPGVLAALAGLDPAGATRGVRGCLAVPGDGSVVALGTVDVVPYPAPIAALARVIAARVPRGARILTVGDDVDALVALRKALAAEAFSVSMAWDGKQAADLLEVTRPELVVVDLGLPRREGYDLLVRLAEPAPPPSVVLLRSAEVPVPDLGGLVDPRRVAHACGRDRVLAQAADPRNASPAAA